MACGGLKPVFVKCLSRFHLFEFTTRKPQVSLVSIGRRGSPCLRFGSEISVHCQWASHASGVPPLNACHFPLASFSKWACSGYTFTRSRAHYTQLGMVSILVPLPHS